MERTTPAIVLAALCEFDACDLGKANQAHLGLNALDFRFGDAGHKVGLSSTNG
ncbi:MAG: hypothetical protein ABJG88_05395 [Litorimonas sp.]